MPTPDPSPIEIRKTFLGNGGRPAAELTKILVMGLPHRADHVRGYPAKLVLSGGARQEILKR